MRIFLLHRHVKTETLSDYLDGQLSPSAQRRVANHLESCPQCQRELQELRSTISHLRELPQQVPTRSFTFTAPPSRVFTTSPSPTMWVPTWAYAGAASLAGLALALLVLVDATGFPTSSTSQISGRVTAQSYTSFEDASAEKEAAPAGPDQYPSAPIPQAAPAEELPVVPATPAAASAVQSEVATEQEKKIEVEITSTPAPAALAQAKSPAAAPTPPSPALATAHVTPAAQPPETRETALTPTSPALAVAEVTAATQPLEVPGSPATPTPSLSGQAAEVDAPGPARRAAGGGTGISRPSGPPPPLVMTPGPASATPAVLPTKVPPPTGARPTPGREEQNQPTAEAGDRVRLAAVPGPDSGPMPEERAGPAGAAGPPSLGPEGQTGNAGPPSQGAESVGPGLTDSAIDSPREVVAPRRRESGSRWRAAQGIAAALALIFIGGLIYEVRRDRRSALL